MQGLGKTVQIISFLHHLKTVEPNNGPHLIVCPRSVLENWFNELRRWCPSFKVVVLWGTKEEREALLRQMKRDEQPQMEICLTTYEVVLKEKVRRAVTHTHTHSIVNEEHTLDITLFVTFAQGRLLSRHHNWFYIIIDEAHRIKNEKSLLAHVVRCFATPRRILITGTPLQNNLRELWALLNFLMPQVCVNQYE